MKNAQPAALRLGEYHPHFGGHYAGLILGGDDKPDHHLFVAPKDRGETTAEYGGQGILTPGAEHTHDGLANTIALLNDKNAKHPAAEFCSKLVIDGHKDFYLPSREELRQAFINCRRFFEPVWYCSSTQYAGSAGNAWLQYFNNGGQNYDDKDWKGRVRAVRRLVL